MMHLLCGTGCKGDKKKTYLRLWFPKRVINILIISLSNFNPSHSHTLSHPNTYLTTTSHLNSLSHRHGRLPLAHVSTAKAGTHTEIPGKVEGLLSSSQVKLYLGKIHSRKVRHMYRSINQKLCRGLHIPQDSYPRRCLV
jgi:hypothetical protein